MKKISLIATVAGLVAFAACTDQEVAPTTSENTLEVENKTVDNSRNASPDWDRFTHVPQVIRDKAQAAWQGQELPAVTFAFSYGNDRLEEGWKVSVYSPTNTCVVGEPNPYWEYYPDYNYGYVTTQNGFVFLDEGELCGDGQYEIDNRQGGWFDYVCGPQGRGFNYQGEPLFVFVRLWCE